MKQSRSCRRPWRLAACLGLAVAALPTSAHAFADAPLLSIISGQMAHSLATLRALLVDAAETLRQTRTIANLANKTMAPLVDANKFKPSPDLFKVPLKQLQARDGAWAVGATLLGDAGKVVGREGERYWDDLQPSFVALGRQPIDKLWDPKFLAERKKVLAEVHDKALHRLGNQAKYALENAKGAVEGLATGSLDVAQKAAMELKSQVATAAASVEGAMSLAALDARQQLHEVAQLEQTTSDRSAREGDLAQVAVDGEAH